MPDFSPWGSAAMSGTGNWNQPSPTAPTPSGGSGGSAGAPTQMPGGGYSTPVGGITDNQPAPPAAPNLPQAIPRPGGTMTGGTPATMGGGSMGGGVPNGGIGAAGAGWGGPGGVNQGTGSVPQGGGLIPRPGGTAGGVGGIGPLLQLLMGGGNQAGSNPVMSLLQMLWQGGQAGGPIGGQGFTGFIGGHSPGWWANRPGAMVGDHSQGWWTNHPGATPPPSNAMPNPLPQGGLVPRPGGTNDTAPGGLIPRPGGTTPSGSPDTGNEIRQGMDVNDWRNQMQGGGGTAGAGTAGGGGETGPGGNIKVNAPPVNPWGNLIPRPGGTLGGGPTGWGGPGGVGQGVSGVPGNVASLMAPLLAQQFMPTQLPTAGGGMVNGLPTVNPMAQQMNALLAQQLMR